MLEKYSKLKSSSIKKSSYLNLKFSNMDKIEIKLFEKEIATSKILLFSNIRYLDLNLNANIHKQPFLLKLIDVILDNSNIISLNLDLSFN